eukprot:GHVO01033584.1.p1 GENE.GHVO01033584.1~~GHVO01033584.1.p1  ORF type:complete len:127 (+),score=24.21 GHVO01033584.1:84-464(+)
MIHPYKHRPRIPGYADPHDCSLLDTARRETLEEIGVSQECYTVDEERVKNLSYKAWGKNKLVSMFPAELRGSPKITISAEHTDFRWCTPAEVRKMTISAWGDVISKAFEEIKIGGGDSAEESRRFD